MNKRSWILALAAVVAVGGALILGVAAQAQEAPAADLHAADLGAAALGETPFAGRFGMREAPEGALGGMLGAARERMARGDFDGHGRGMKGDDHQMMQVVADQLGLTIEELLAELRGGKTVADLAAEQEGVTLEDIEAAILDKVKEHLDQAVADGRMDQERADEMLAKFQEHIGELLTKELPFGHGPGSGGPGSGGRGGRGGHGGHDGPGDCGDFGGAFGAAASDGSA